MYVMADLTNDLYNPASKAGKLFRRRFRVPYAFYRSIVQRIRDEKWGMFSETLAYVVVLLVAVPCMLLVAIWIINITALLSYLIRSNSMWLRRGEQRVFR
jgi:hypothetical protein